MKQQKGFTLIELIIVIIILGILAVTAAPRFFNFATDARTSVLQGIEGSIKGANQMVYGRASIKGATSGVSTVDVDSSTTVGTLNGYVQAGDISSILNAADFTFVDSADPAADYAADPVVPGSYYVISTALVADAADPAAPTVAEVEAIDCYLSYTDAVAGAEPVIELNTDGC